MATTAAACLKPRASTQAGFTLIELMVVIAIIAIISLIGVPGYQALIRSNNITSATNNLMGALQLARSEAAIRRLKVTVCPSTDGATCSGGNNWNSGGLVILTTAGTILRAIPPTDGGVTITGTKIDYRGDGSSQTGGSLTVAHPDGGSKTVKVNLIGQACSGDSCS